MAWPDGRPGRIVPVVVFLPFAADTPWHLLIGLAVTAALTLGSWRVGQARGRPRLGLVLGLLLGLAGLVAIAVWPRPREAPPPA